MALNNSRSIDELLITVNKIKEGDLKARAELNTNDEFEILANQFNDMVIALNESMNRNIELNALKTQAEKKQLIAQFNPHFLFNTLETIRYLILTTPEEASNLIFKTTQLLRYSLHQADELVLLKNDLEYTRLYCEIQKTRFAEKFDYNLNLSEEILNQMVPKLMLQPIIENSIIHGFKKKNRLEVNVEGTIQDNRICLIIKDNGQGISIDKLEDINRIILNKENSSNHQGIYNVYKRLYLVYEDELVFEIQSSTMGTEIKVSFPRGT
jgi:sensor histidine kinase YesM